jgi:hypothetical protein
MTDDPFLTLLVEALNLMHPRFAAAHGRLEFYHQFRRLWDKALPVKLGLGHVVVQPDPAAPPGPQPDLLFWQLGEHGAPDRRLAAVSVVQPAAPEAVAAAGVLLGRYRGEGGYPQAVCVAIGREADVPAVGGDGVAMIVYDTDRRTATVRE